jgi:hypothetical protein
MDSTLRQHPMIPPTATTSYVVLASLINGQWHENKYEVSDKNWKEALKILKDANVRCKLLYK